VTTGAPDAAPASDVRPRVVATLRAAGCVSPEEEADLLISAATERRGSIHALVERRERGEPLAWIVGWTRFCDVRVGVDPGVFVPRPHTEWLARRAAELLPDDGIGVDLCTGSGAVAAVMRSTHPKATILGTDVDGVAVTCARSNGVDARVGDLDEPLPSPIRGRVDVVTAVVPYVPTEEIHLLPRDVVAHEPRRALDGGAGGTAVLVRAARAAPALLRPGGTGVFEIGGDQATAIADTLEEGGLDVVRVHRDEEGLDRAIEVRRRSA
jgi:release factor glutamine methyltransferase